MADTLSDLLPPKFRNLLTPPGTYRRGAKVAITGGPGGGKSFISASAPKPLFVMDFGESGIQSYLQEGDTCVCVTNGAHYLELLDWACKNESKIGSVVGDGGNLIWSNYMEEWTEELQTDEIKGGQWKKVKGPWKIAHYRAMYATWNLIYTSHVKDVAYEQVAGAPGEAAKLVIKPQIAANMEKSLPYLFDFIFYTEVVLNAKNMPTSKHKVTMLKGRRPKSIPPAELHAGKAWTYDALKPPDSVWDSLMGPIIKHWGNGAVDHLGVEVVGEADLAERSAQLRAMEEMSQNETLGRVLGIIQGATSLAGYREVFEKEVMPEVLQLSKDRQEQVKKAHEARKVALGAKG